MYNFIVKDKDFLFSDKERELREDCKLENLIGEEQTLTSTCMNDAFLRILDDFIPKHNKAIFSLCSSTRPYIKSLKWQTLYKHFGNIADLIVCSDSGCVIPMEYMCCFPFTDYDAHRVNSKADALYNLEAKKKLEQFLNKFSSYYDKIVYTFIPNSRTYNLIFSMGVPNGVLLPSKKVYEDIRKYGCVGVNTLRYPQCAAQSLEEIAQHLDVPFVTNKKIDLF